MHHGHHLSWWLPLFLFLGFSGIKSAIINIALLGLYVAAMTMIWGSVVFITVTWFNANETMMTVSVAGWMITVGIGCFIWAIGLLLGLFMPRE